MCVCVHALGVSARGGKSWETLPALCQEPPGCKSCLGASLTPSPVLGYGCHPAWLPCSPGTFLSPSPGSLQHHGLWDVSQAINHPRDGQEEVDKGGGTPHASHKERLDTIASSQSENPGFPYH